MAKRKSEHRAVRVETPGSWEADMRRIEAKCDEMQGEGWTLLAMSWPSNNNAVLMFARAKGREVQ